MIRRSRRVVSVTGNKNYWAGADEMQNVFGPYLTERLSGIKHNIPEAKMYPDLRGWMYASDDLIDKYRKDDRNYSGIDEYKLKKIISWCVSNYGREKNSTVFVDKSQVYTVKISYIDRLLEGANTKFIFVTRNPYALCYRAPLKSKSMKKMSDYFSRMDKIRIAAEHWRNSAESVIDDKQKGCRVMHVRFEDVLNETAKYTKKLCHFIEVPFDDSMLPSSSDVFPLGSKRRKRWHPIRQDVNEKYLRKISRKEAELVAGALSGIEKKFGYSSPNK